MHRDTPHQKHKQQHAQQMPPKRHQHPPAARQRPSLDQELYAASCKARTTNPARIYAAPRIAPTPHAVTARAGTATPAIPQRPNRDRPFYAASRKARTTNPARIYAADCRAKPALPARRPNPQRPNLGHEVYAASRKARTKNQAPIHAAPRTAPTPRATTIAAKMAAAETAKTKASTAPTGRHMPPSRPNPRPNLGRRFYAASCKPRTTNPALLYAAPRIAPPIGAVQHPGAGMPSPPQPNPERQNLGRQLYAAACMAGATTSARRPSPQTPNLRRHPYAASCKVDAIAPLYAAPCNRVPASRTYQG